MKKYILKKYMPWHTFFLLVLVALSIQGCLGIGGNSGTGNQNFKSVNTNNGQTLQVNTSNSAPRVCATNFDEEPNELRP